MLVVHANWTDGALHVWGESLERYSAWLRSRSSAADLERPASTSGTTPDSFTNDHAHPFTLAQPDVAAALASLGVNSSAAHAGAESGALRVRLPRDHAGPLPSDRLARMTVATEPGGGEERDLQLAAAAQDDMSYSNGDGIGKPGMEPWLGEFAVESLALHSEQAVAALLGLGASDHDPRFELGQSLRYWIVAAQFITDLLIEQRFIPTLLQSRARGLRGAWQPWLHDQDVRQRVGALLVSMPPIARAAVNEHAGLAWPILDEALRALTDATVRHALMREAFLDAIDGRDPQADLQVAWLAGLLGADDHVPAPLDQGLELVRDASAWVARLTDAQQDRPLRLCLKLDPPPEQPHSVQAPRDEPAWRLSLHLQSTDDPDLMMAAEQVWQPASASGRGAAADASRPQEVLLAELGRASRIYPAIETALAEHAPALIDLSTQQAYEFLREYKPLLEEAGFGVIAPSWWDQPRGRIGARLQLQPVAPLDAPAASSTAASLLGLNSLVEFRWQVAIGDQPLTAQEFESLADQTSTLLKVRGQWIEIDPQQLADARRFIQETPSGTMTLLQAIRIANEADGRHRGLPVFGLDAQGWVADVLGASGDPQRLQDFPQPREFVGTLRPYQLTGLRWLAFLDRYGLGACLADDMGLGKTIQLIALLLHERQSPEPCGPTLLIVPTSVVSNWIRELQRFAPSLTAHVHHGAERPLDERFADIAQRHDVVITTYPLVSRDHETLRRVSWHRVALDEAQYIKNPPTKQTMAIRSLNAPRRLALTGTPVENRLTELWSIMEFCNPGYLGAAAEFRRRFAVPIERRRDVWQGERLRSMVRPFVLRRLKTDPTVIQDLPRCIETKEYATLTPEQAALYQRAVDSMLHQVAHAQGIHRRGLVLATLVKLKQICNHPVQAQDDGMVSGGDGAASLPAHPFDASPVQSSRSGKARRLMEMLEEVLATGERALVFTQFRRMGHLLTAMIQSDLDAEPLFLHGGTPAAKRQHLIDRFQDPEGGAPIFVLSLKAGGLGLNLTAASHVFHFDRWWNPAVEKQATDRAYRIGQTRNVHVHKFVCVGTLEERIDQMIEQKTDLAQNIIGAGEQWLTELSTAQLQDVLTLRQPAMEGEP